MKRIILGAILALAILFPTVSAQSFGLQGGLGIYSYGMCNCSDYGISYDNQTLRFRAMYRPTDISIGLGLLAIIFDPTKLPDPANIHAAINGSFGLVDMLKNISFTQGQYYHTPEVINETYTKPGYTAPATLCEIFIFLFANHSVTNEQSIWLSGWDDYWTPNTPASLSMSLDSSPPVIVSVTWGNSTVPVVPIAIGAGIALVAVLVVVLYRRHTHKN